MSYPEHKRKFNQGAVAWNAWRRDNPDVKPNLQGVTLSGDLRAFHFSEIDFGTCLLFGADISVADVRHSKFHLATMRGADFTRAEMSHANLERAELNLHLKMG